jgi:FkbM family methyltransferase
MMIQSKLSIFLRKLRVALTPRNWLLRTELDSGVVVYGKNRAGFGGRGIYIYREEIETEFQHFTKFLDVGAVFVDVGASTGIYTLLAAKHIGPNGIVLSIEPFPDVLDTLYHNIQANGFSNVRLRSFCIGAKTEVASFWMNAGRPNSYGLVQHDSEASATSMLSVALDDLFLWEGLERLDYLKIDAEGAEQMVLAGAATVLAKYRPVVQMEVNILDPTFDLPNYAVFRAPKSANKLYIPEESPYANIPIQLGWQQLQ